LDSEKIIDTRKGILYTYSSRKFGSFFPSKTSQKSSGVIAAGRMGVPSFGFNHSPGLKLEGLECLMIPPICSLGFKETKSIRNRTTRKPGAQN